MCFLNYTSLAPGTFHAKYMPEIVDGNCFEINNPEWLVNYVDKSWCFDMVAVDHIIARGTID